MQATLDVVLPVHGAAADLERCLRSVVAHSDLACHRLVVVVDGPQPAAVEEVIGHLETGAAQVLLLRQPARLGFAAAVNRGIGAGTGDVVLLNSDTEVPAGWLDRLASAATARPRVGTVTPFSNNATICSLPRFLADNLLPAGHTTESFAALVERVSERAYPELPTGVGFCLLVRREMLREVGGLDERRFGRGYGEETDLCWRGRAAGFLHVLDDATFVWHRGSASFGAQRRARVREAERRMRRHHRAYEPAIADFIRRDPLRPLRERVRRALAEERRPLRRAPGTAERPVSAARAVTHLVHGWPPFAHGGTELYAAWLARWQSSLRHVAVYARIGDPAGQGAEARELQEGALRVRLVVNDFTQRDPLSRNAIHDRGRLRDFARFLDEERPDLLHVHHLAGHAATLPMAARRRRIPIVFQVQDWWAVCARVNLLDRSGRLCSGPGLGKCSACLPLTGLRPRTLSNRLLYWVRRKAMRRALGSADLLLFGSQFAHDSYRTLGWLPRGVAACVVPYGVAVADGHERPRRAPSSPVRFGFLGSLLPHKGLQVAIEAFGEIDPAAAVLEVWGDPAGAPALAADLERSAPPAVHFRGAFAESEKARVLDALDVLLVPSLGLESFGLAAREALHLGKPVLASARGALMELSLGGGRGELFPPGDAAELRRLVLRWASELVAGRSVEPLPAKGVAEHAYEVESLYDEVLRGGLRR